MSDHTYVTLKLLIEHVDLAKEILRQEEESIDDYWPIGDRHYCLGFQDVDGGSLDAIPALVAHGIPLDASWESGAEYTEGTNYIRFTPEGDVVDIDVFDVDINPSMNMLMLYIDNHEYLKKYILEHYHKVTPVDLDSKQIEYGKLYRAHRLINPDHGKKSVE